MCCQFPCSTEGTASAVSHSGGTASPDRPQRHLAGSLVTRVRTTSTAIPRAPARPGGRACEADAWREHAASTGADPLMCWGIIGHGCMPPFCAAEPAKLHVHQPPRNEQGGQRLRHLHGPWAPGRRARSDQWRGNGRGAAGLSDSDAQGPKGLPTIAERGRTWDTHEQRARGYARTPTRVPSRALQQQARERAPTNARHLQSRLKHIPPLGVSLPSTPPSRNHASYAAHSGRSSGPMSPMMSRTRRGETGQLAVRQTRLWAGCIRQHAGSKEHV